MHAFTGMSRLAVRVFVTTVLALLMVSVPASAQTPAAAQPKTGGTLRIGIWSDVVLLNPYFTTNGLFRGIAETTLEGLTRGTPDGTYEPVLAEEIPTPANGDVSPDGTIVTWKLKQGVVWSDGQPFTSQDVVFTYQVLTDPSNPIDSNTRADIASIKSVTAADDHTAVVTYKEVHAAYTGAFGWVFPAHIFNGKTSIAQDPFVHAPSVGTGPFVFASWSPGESIEFDRNPNYREPGKPYLDKVIYKIIPSLEADVQALRAGDVDVAYLLSEDYIPQLQAVAGIAVEPVASANVERLYLNTSCPNGPQQGDPACPHPILGDLNMRRAIALSIDKQSLVHNLLFDQTRPATSVIPVGPYAVDLGANQFDPEQARQLLDQSGWLAGADGIRSRAGVRAHLTLTTTAGDNFREEEEQLIQQDMQAIGLDIAIQNVPVPLLTGGFAANSWLNLGSFDIALLMGGYYTDPQSAMLGFFGSNAVPNPQTQSGNNFSRVQDPGVDEALAAAGATVDTQARVAAYTSFSRLLAADAGTIPLYGRLETDAHTTALQGWQTNVNDYLAWNAQDWWLNQ